jgi:hypothetical protein
LSYGPEAADDNNATSPAAMARAFSVRNWCWP